MTLWSLPKWLWRDADAPDRGGAQRLLSMARFQAALERERMRADRGGSHFTLIEFAWPGVDQALCDRIVALLEQRLRATDELGDVPNGIGVLLPATGSEGAQQLAEYVAEELPSAIAIRWTIRQYPESNSGAITLPVYNSDLETATKFTHAAWLFIKPLPLWKRSIDVFVASIGLLLFSPVLVVAAIAIKLASDGPVLFLQRRAGVGGKPFTIYKLRTMCVNAENMKQQLRAFSQQDGPAFKIKNDPRTTLVGKYLRKTCIDELPQLWNVLIGDMTLVGPRPLPCDESDGCEDWERRRLDVTPGLTCIWQVRSGRSCIPFSEWMRMDLRYIRQRSLVHDAKLLWKTFVAVVMHRASH